MENIKKYRCFSEKEIDILINQGCSADNWQLIKVVQDFKTANIHNVIFIGKNFLGRFKSTITTKDGVIKPCGIFNATLSDCIINNDVHINNVKQYISGYKISDNVIIDNISLLATSPNSTFGNGTEVAVLNEAGGREIKIFNELSAQIAYLMVIYRHRNKFINKMSSLIEDYSDNIKSDTGVVANNSVLQNCGIIRNVNIGEYSNIEGVSLLENGSIISSFEDPVYIGTGVIAKDFIFAAGAHIMDSAILSECFIGEGCNIGNQLSAESSLLFANSEGFHGEFLSVFAGPYTVSHHKSTLLIAAMYSFYNAGSGSNASNHMHRLGPVHQGILERGCKTGSFSYLIWPSHVGAFSSVIGKHSTKFDTSDLPFSYISEKKGKSKIAPGLNYFNVGTIRDSIKWPNRDRRKSTNKNDLIIFDVLTPYTIQKVINGQKILNTLATNSTEGQEFVKYNGINIKVSMIDSYCQHYEIILNKYLGEKLVKRLSKEGYEKSFRDFKKKNKMKSWVDIAGLIAPMESINKLIESVESGSVSSINSLTSKIKNIYTQYSEYEWQWIINLLEEKLNKKAADFIPADLVPFIIEWKKINIKYTELVINDAEKEFDQNAQIGFGIDGDEIVRMEDFSSVRGNFETNSFVKQMKEELITQNDLGDKILKML